MKKVLICGASGFMGQNIIEQLADKYELYGVNFHCDIETPAKSKLKKIYTCDLTTQKGIIDVFEDERFDVVIQAAATTSGVKDIVERPYIHVTNNAVMNSLLLRACYDYSVGQFIFLSCGVMYQPGDTPKKETDYNESDAIFKNYFGIGWTKVYIEKMCEFYSRLGRTKCMAIRHTNTYGPYDKYDYEHSHVFGATIRKVLESTGEIEVWGNGTETARDLLYASDVCEFIELAIEKQTKPFDLVNVSLGRFVTVKELVEKIIACSGKDIKIKYDTSKPAISTKLCLDNFYAKQEYGWVPKIELEEGITKTLNWYKGRIDGK